MIPGMTFCDDVNKTRLDGNKIRWIDQENWAEVAGNDMFGNQYTHVCCDCRSQRIVKKNRKWTSPERYLSEPGNSEVLIRVEGAESHLQLPHYMLP